MLNLFAPKSRNMYGNSAFSRVRLCRFLNVLFVLICRPCVVLLDGSANSNRNIASGKFIFVRQRARIVLALT